MATYVNNNILLKNAVDPTKGVTFDTNNISTATTRTIQYPNATTQLIGTNDNAIVTNKTIIDSSNNVAANSLKTTGTAVTISASAPPAGAGYTIKTTSATNATWQAIVTPTIYTTTNSTSIAPTIPTNLIEYYGTSTVSGGLATFYITNNSSPSGTALFTNAIGGSSIYLFANSSRNGSSTTSDTPVCAFYDISNFNRTLRISVRVGQNVGILGAPSMVAAPNGLRVWLHLVGS